MLSRISIKVAVMYTQYQRFITAAFLFNLWLQSCGNPTWKLTEEEVAQPIDQLNKPKQLEKHRPATFVHNHSGASALSSQHAMRAPCSKSSYQLPGGEVSHALCTTLYAASDGRCSTSSTVLPQCVRASSLYQPFSIAKRSEQSSHLVLNPQASSLRKGFQASRFRSVLPAASTMPTALLAVPQPSTQDRISRHQDVVGLQFTSQPMASLRVSIGPFELSSGKRVVFSQVDGQWNAWVQEVWDMFPREISLPVICQGDPSVVLQNLEGKGAMHMRRRLHILETDQIAKASRFVYVGYLGLRGGMQPGAKQIQERANTMSISSLINRGVVSVQDSQLHEAVAENPDDGERHQVRSKRFSERNPADRLALSRSLHTADDEQKKDTKGKSKGQSTQELPSSEVPTAWHPPFVVREESVSTCPHWVQAHLQFHDVPSPSTLSTSEVPLVSCVPAVHANVANEQAAEDTKMPILPCVTTLNSPEAACEAVSAYLARWRLETPLRGVWLFENKGKAF